MIRSDQAGRMKIADAETADIFLLSCLLRILKEIHSLLAVLHAPVFFCTVKRVHQLIEMRNCVLFNLKRLEFNIDSLSILASINRILADFSGEGLHWRPSKCLHTRIRNTENLAMIIRRKAPSIFPKFEFFHISSS